MRAATYANSTLLRESERLEKEIDEKYAGGALPLVVDAAGCHTRATAATIERLEADFPDEEAVDRIRLPVAIGVACVRAEVESRADYIAAVQQCVAAQALATGGGRGVRTADGGSAEAAGDAEARRLLADASAHWPIPQPWCGNRGAAGAVGQGGGGAEGEGVCRAEGRGAVREERGAESTRLATPTNAGLCSPVAPVFAARQAGEGASGAEAAATTPRGGAGEGSGAERARLEAGRTGGGSGGMAGATVQAAQEAGSDMPGVRLATPQNAGFGLSVAPTPAAVSARESGSGRAPQGAGARQGDGAAVGLTAGGARGGGGVPNRSFPRTGRAGGGVFVPRGGRGDACGGGYRPGGGGGRGGRRGGRW